jgi:hypothetical protein
MQAGMMETRRQPVSKISSKYVGRPLLLALGTKTKMLRLLKLCQCQCQQMHHQTQTTQHSLAAWHVVVGLDDQVLSGGGVEQLHVGVL